MNEQKIFWVPKNYFKGNGEVKKSGRVVHCFPGNIEGEYNLSGQEKETTICFAIELSETLKKKKNKEVRLFSY